jgi:hypothetical protein
VVVMVISPPRRTLRYRISNRPMPRHQPQIPEIGIIFLSPEFSLYKNSIQSTLCVCTSSTALAPRPISP